MASNSGGNSTAAYDPRQIWATNLAPLVIAAREGAAQAVRTANRERTRARQQPAWWRRRWVIVTAAGLAVVGVVGGVSAALANRRAGIRELAGPAGRPTGTGYNGMRAGSHERADGLKSTVVTGRAKATGMARNMVHKLRGSEAGGVAPEAPEMPAPISNLPDEST